MISGFDHVVVLANEIEAATTAYQTLFARTPSWRHGGEGAQRALFTLDNMTVELVAPDGEGARGDLVRNVLAAPGPRQHLLPHQRHRKDASPARPPDPQTRTGVARREPGCNNRRRHDVEAAPRFDC